MLEKILLETKALMKGHYLLTSGKHSEFYVEKIKIINHPKYVETICAILVKKLKKYDFDIVVGPAYGGIVLAYEIARRMGKKFVFTQRKDEKMTIRSGFEINTGDKAIIVEDIVTTGGSIKEVIDVLKQQGIDIQAVCCIVDRSNDTAKFDYDFISLLNMNIESFSPEECPLCQKGIPLTKPGASDKAKL